MLDLGQQSHHYRGHHAYHLHGRCGRAVPRLDWNVLRVGDANDIDRIEHAVAVFRQTKGRPTFIVLDNHIGYGSPHKQDTLEAHGEPLGEDEIRRTKRSYGWPEDAKFFVPEGVYDHFKAGIGKHGEEARKQWTKLFDAYRKQFPDPASEIGRDLLINIKTRRNRCASLVLLF